MGIDVSGLDALSYSVRLYDDDQPLTTGTVVMHLCPAGSYTPFNASASLALAHVGGGRWQARHSVALVTAALAGVSIGAAFDRVLTVDGAATRKLKSHRRVLVVG